jgi:hypothetical protein
MTAYELADYILISKHHASICGVETADMLRQQEQTIERYHNMMRDKDVEIADLKIANQDLKYQLIIKSGEQVLNDFFAKEILKKASEK